MLKILQARLKQYVNRELSDVQGGFKKAEEPEIKLPTSTGSLKKQGSSRSQRWEILEEMGIPDHLICLLRNLYAGQEATVRAGHGTD